MQKYFPPPLAPGDKWRLLRTALAGLLWFGLGSGCAMVEIDRTDLLAKPGMRFSHETVYIGPTKIMQQVQPGLATSGGAQASTCTICR